MIGSLIIGMGRASFFLQIFLFWFGKLMLPVSIRGLSLPEFLTLTESKEMAQWVWENREQNYRRQTGNWLRRN